ncbi:Uncharacterised protein [uncultured archaeon]|nr:Uncharacterised protein [uncultured archaeon]
MEINIAVNIPDDVKIGDSGTGIVIAKTDTTTAASTTDSGTTTETAADTESEKVADNASTDASSASDTTGTVKDTAVAETTPVKADDTGKTETVEPVKKEPAATVKTAVNTSAHNPAERIREARLARLEQIRNAQKRMAGR